MPGLEPDLSSHSARDPTFGVVLINWNNARDTLECLTSLLLADPLPQRVVVVDNGSDDDSVGVMRAWIQQTAPGLPVAIIEARRNLGFAGGTNVGIRSIESGSDVSHFLLLNNDATVTPGFFADIAEAIRSSPTAGLIGPTIMDTGGQSGVWYAGGTELPWRALYRHSHEVPASRAPVPTDFVTGCAMVVSRAVLERIGPLAECYYPAYWEDGEYSFRARAAGFPVLYAPAALVYHKVGSTVRAAGLTLFLEQCKNRLRVFYVRRNYRGATRIVALAYLAITKPGRAVLEAIKGRPRLGAAILRGTISGFTSRDALRHP